MSAVERLEAAIEKLERLLVESTAGPWSVKQHPEYPAVECESIVGPGGDEVATFYNTLSWHPGDVPMVLALHRTVDAQLAILRHTLVRIEAADEVLAAMDVIAGTNVGVLALADAILAGGPLSPSESARVAVFGLDQPED